MPDRNYYSYDGVQADDTEKVFDPSGPDWPPGSWQDTLRFYKRYKCKFSYMTVVKAGTEDGVDISNANIGNIFSHFTVPCGKQGLTFKGGNHDNTLEFWLFTKIGKHVEAEFGNWHSSNFEWFMRGNVCLGWRREDGEPVRYAARLGTAPRFISSNVRRIWWLSIGLTLYWIAKWILVKLHIINP